MAALAPVFDRLCADIARLTAARGRRVDAAALGVLDRAGQLPLGPPNEVSPNGACRMVCARDGWLAVNLAREDDRELVPAWLCEDIGEPPWAMTVRAAPRFEAAELVERAILLGLPVARVGEVRAGKLRARRLDFGVPGEPRAGALRVVDLSALWAGPLCGAVLAAMGAEVIRIESLGRPDPTPRTLPAFARRLRRGKADLVLDLADPAGRARLAQEVARADVLVTSARPHALGRLELAPPAVFDRNPRLVWAAVTGYGWAGEAGARVAFGDDAAAAGDLVRWTASGPQFLGDALADPLTGLVAAKGVLDALATGGGVLVDAAMASCAAGAAHAMAALATAA